MDSIPDRFPATLIDCIEDFLIPFGNVGINLEMEFDERLDDGRLEKAVDLALDAEPVLGCRFVDDACRPYLERLQAERRSGFLRASSAIEYASFKSSPMDHKNGPQISVCLWHSPGGDRLLLKVSHQVADAAGLKDIAAILSGIYRQLAEDPAHRPSPNVKERRSLWRVLRHVPVLAYPRILLNSTEGLMVLLKSHPVHTLSVPDGPREPLTHVTRLIPSGRVSALAEYGRSHDATLNDVFLAASLRGLVNMTDWDGRSRLSLVTSLDMRRYIPSGRAEAVANFSTSVLHWPDLGTEPGRDFAATLGRVSRITGYGKTHWIGLEQLLVQGTPLWKLVPHRPAKKAFANIARRAIRRQVQEHLFTNTGPIDPDVVNFGVRPSVAHILPPQTFPPIPFDYGLSGCDGTLTLTAGAYPTQKETIAFVRHGLPVRCHHPGRATEEGCGGRREMHGLRRLRGQVPHPRHQPAA